MRVLHIDNPSNVACEIRDNIRDVKCRVVELYPNGYKWGSDEILWMERDEDNLIPPLRRFYRLLKLIIHHDIIHIHCGLSGDMVNLAKICKSLGKKVISHHHGTTLRTGLVDENAERKYVDATIVSTPDLLRFLPSAVYIPNPFTPLSPSTEQEEIIVHAHGTNSHSKGTKVIEKVFHQLEKEGLKCRIITGLPHQEALAQYRKASIAVDQLEIGWYGMFSLECMSMGIPTICRIDETLGNPPLVRASVENLKGVILSLVADEGRREIAKAQRNYVLQVHNPRRIADMFKAVYEDVNS